MVALLITEGSVDVNKAATAKGLTPLYIAAEDNHIEIVNLLLKGKADVNSKTDIGWTPLFIGIFHGHTDVVKLLLQEGGADADLPRNDGWTPLMVAAHKGRTAEVELLLALEGIPRLHWRGGSWPRRVLHLALHGLLVGILLHGLHLLHRPSLLPHRRVERSWLEYVLLLDHGWLLLRDHRLRSRHAALALQDRLRCGLHVLQLRRHSLHLHGLPWLALQSLECICCLACYRRQWRC